MKKIAFFAAASALVLAASCSTKSTQEADAAAEAVEQETVNSTVAVAPVATDGKVLELTDASLVAPGVNVEQLTVIDFNAVWCGPCRQLTPVLEEMAAKYAGKATFISVDVDKFPELFEAYNVGNSIPAVVILSTDGKRQDYVGTAELLPAESFQAIIDSKL